MKVLIVGDSHTGVLNQARREMARAGTLPEGIDLDIRPLAGGPTLARPFFEEIDGVAHMTEPGIKARMRRLPPEGEAYDVIALSGPLHSVRVWRNMDWARHRLEPTEGFAPVSAALFRRLVMDDQGPMLRLALLLQKHVRSVLVIEPPRPFRHHPSVEALGADMVLDLDRRYRAIVREWLGAHGVGTVDVPAHCIGPDGFMKAEHRSGKATDPHHGSSAFGALMLDALARALAPASGKPAVERTGAAAAANGASSAVAERLAEGQESQYVAGQ
jgi:hypothetical protein